MKSLCELCEPRDSIFDPSKRDTVLNLSHLVADQIDPADFFEENHVTGGMKTLLEESFRRLQGKTDQAVFKLTQAMGGGKTHNLISLGLLAKHPEFRSKVLNGLPSAAALPEVRVVAFSGRETDVPHGIWGEIASQLGKEEVFAGNYSPLKAPGPSAWTTLLKGAPTLILLDELPPYLDNARSITVGNSDLAKVTATALTNLFDAISKNELGNVCIVLTDLVGTYEDASAQIEKLLQQLQDEAHRYAMNLTPVQINTDEFYQIIRKRLFKTCPTSDEQPVAEIAQGYAKAVREAKQMDITAQSPEQFAQLVQSSYPFHPAIKDLYARFRENRGFQQTRALIRLMRIIASKLWKSGEAKKKYLIAVHDIDLNDPDTLSEIRQINPSLENAISHDIAAEGQAVAEIMDQNLGGTDARDACRLLFMSSLANVPNAIVGLSIAELVAYLCEPGRNVVRIKSEILEKLATAAWYLHSNRDGKLFFKNVENLNAKLESLAKAYIREQSLKELRDRLKTLFHPTNGWCFQDVLVLPSPDEITLSTDRVCLVISEPFVGQGLNPQLQAFWDQTSLRNRVAFLTGARNTFESLIENAKRVKAVQQILNDMVTDKVPETDPQFKQADELKDRIIGQFLSAVKETFSTLYYPTKQGAAETLAHADFLMKYDGNKYEGEQQIVQVLKDKQKYTEDVTSDIFRKKVEQRLFTQPLMLWSEIKKRAAINCQWQWHRRDALDELKRDMVHKEAWREDSGGYVDRSPPPPKTTSIQIQERSRDDQTGQVELKVTPVHGDTVHAETGAEATTASQVVENGLYTTNEMEVSFLAVDSTGAHPAGPALTWQNRLTLRYRFFSGNGGERRIELKAAPFKEGKTSIRYSTDGSDPKVAGGVYDGPVTLAHGTPLVLAYAQYGDIVSEVLTIPVNWDKKDTEKPIDPERPLVWKRRQEAQLTLESYALLDMLGKHQGRAVGVKLSVIGDCWAELTLHEKVELAADQLRTAADMLRTLPGSGQLGIEWTAVHFDRGQYLLDWVSPATFAGRSWR